MNQKITNGVLLFFFTLGALLLIGYLFQYDWVAGIFFSIDLSLVVVFTWWLLPPPSHPSYKTDELTGPTFRGDIYIYSGRPKMSTLEDHIPDLSPLFEPEGDA